MTILTFLVIVLMIIQMAIFIYDTYIKLSTVSEKKQQLTGLSKRLQLSIVWITTSILLIYAVNVPSSQQHGIFSIPAIGYLVVLFVLFLLQCVYYVRNRRFEVNGETE